MSSKSDETSGRLTNDQGPGEVSRREFIAGGAAAVGAAALAPSLLFAATSKTKRPPNILFILTDNQPASMIGCYGSPDIKTPHIDRLADEGTRFTEAFAVNGLCSPTRATLMTGLIPSQHGVHDWIDDYMIGQRPADWCAVQEFRTLPLTLANRGYRTSMIGKYHMGQPRHVMPGFQEWVTFPYGHTQSFWHNTIIDNGREFKLDGKHIVEFFAEKGADWLRRYDGKKPFYLQLNFDGPYLLPPTNLGPDPNPFYKEYLGKQFKAWPRTRFSEEILKHISGPDDPNNFELHLIYDCIRMHQDPESMANMASQNAMVDYGVGIVVDALRERGLDENTLLVFTTDQADFYGQHGLYGHTNFTVPSVLYDAVLNIPLIMRQPGVVPAGKVNDLMIGQYDFLPTLLDCAGFGAVPIANTPGRSFAPALRGEKIAAWGEDVFFEQEESRGIRTRKYAYWKRLPQFGKSALFDVEKDPEQNTDVIDRPEYQKIAQELDQKLTAFFARYLDPQYDLWNNGKTKSFTGRTAILDRKMQIGWVQDTAPKPMFKDTK
jgi:arylsulfatase A-like enzyme